MSGAKENYAKKYGSYADAVLKARARASSLGRNHRDYPQAVADLERVKKEALEAMKTGMVHPNSLLAAFVSEVAGTLVKDGYHVSIDPKDGRDPIMTVSR
jgi:hypothetical protein